jgi:hypothetical protein
LDDGQSSASALANDHVGHLKPTISASNVGSLPFSFSKCRLKQSPGENVLFSTVPDTGYELDAKVTRFGSLVDNAKHIILLLGAGVSAAANIPVSYCCWALQPPCCLLLRK